MVEEPKRSDMFPELSAENDDQDGQLAMEPQEIESLCVNCEQNASIINDIMNY